MLSVVLVASALASLASSSLLSDLDGTAWKSYHDIVAFDVNSTVCGTAGGRFGNTGLFEDLVEESPGVLTGIWTEDYEGLCSKRRPSGRNRYGPFVFAFDEDRLTFSGTWAHCDDEASDSRTWNGIRASRLPGPLVEENCPEQYGGPTPVPANTPTASPTPPPLDFSRRPPGPTITVDLAGDERSDGTYELAAVINIGPVSDFGSDGRLVASKSGDAIIYALLQLVIVITVGELSVEIAKLAAERSISLASWNRLRAYEATLSPITSLVQALLLTARTTSKREFRLPSRNTIWGAALGVFVIVVDLGLLLGSQYSSREYTKDEVFAPVVVLGTDASRRIYGVPTVVEIPIRSESYGFAFNRNLLLSAETLILDTEDQGITTVSLFSERSTSYLTLMVSQNVSSWLYRVSLSWRASRREGEIEPVVSFGPNPENTLVSWLQNFAKEVQEHSVVDLAARASADGGFSGLVVLNGSIADPSGFRYLAGEHLVGSLSLTNEAREDVPYGAVLWTDPLGSQQLVQRDFIVGVGQKPRMSTKVLCIVAGLSTALALVTIGLLWRREGHDVSPLIKQHFGLQADAILWKVWPESEFVTLTGGESSALAE